MPCLNRVFEEMDVKYGNRKVPSKILKSVEEKASRATMARTLQLGGIKEEEDYRCAKGTYQEAQGSKNF